MKAQLSLLICFVFLCLNSSSALQIVFDTDVCLIHTFPLPGKPINMTAEEKYCSDPRHFLNLKENKCYGLCKIESFIRLENGECGEPCPQGWNGNLSNDRCYNPDRTSLNTYGFYTWHTECTKKHEDCLIDYESSRGNNHWGTFFTPACVGKNFYGFEWCKRRIDSPNTYAAKSRLGCKEGFEQVNDLCYPKCPAGMRVVGDICKESCPKGYNECGNVCTRGSCNNLQLKNWEAFIQEVQFAGAKNLPGVSFDFDSLMCSSFQKK